MNRSVLMNLLSWVAPQILVGVAVFFAADSAARFQENQDLRKETQIWARFAAVPALHTSDIGVVVRDGKAVLHGAVDSPSERVLAERVAATVPGIKRVENRLAIGHVRRAGPRYQGRALASARAASGGLT